MARVLLTGMSGTGKTSVTKSLSALGYMAVDLDSEEWSHWVDVPGDPTGSCPGKDWVWRDDAVQQLLAEDARGGLFVSGCAANMGIFLPQFDHVILLTAPVDVMLTRLATRSEQAYGKEAAEIAAVLSNTAEVEPMLRKIAGHEIDTRQPLHEVVATVLRIAGCSVPVDPETGLSMEALNLQLAQAEERAPFAEALLEERARVVGQEGVDARLRPEAFDVGHDAAAILQRSGLQLLRRGPLDL